MKKLIRKHAKQHEKERKKFVGPIIYLLNARSLREQLCCIPFHDLTNPNSMAKK
jgi:hypothetical protein